MRTVKRLPVRTELVRSMCASTPATRAAAMIARAADARELETRATGPRPACSTAPKRVNPRTNAPAQHSACTGTPATSSFASRENTAQPLARGDRGLRACMQVQLFEPAGECIDGIWCRRGTRSRGTLGTLLRWFGDQAQRCASENIRLLRHENPGIAAHALAGDRAVDRDHR